MSKLSRGIHDQVPLRWQDGKILLGRQVICLDVHILSLWSMFLFSTFRKTFQKVQFPPSERRQKADKNKKKKKKRKKAKSTHSGKKRKYQLRAWTTLIDCSSASSAASLLPVSSLSHLRKHNKVTHLSFSYTFSPSKQCVKLVLLCCFLCLLTMLD